MSRCAWWLGLVAAATAGCRTTSPSRHSELTILLRPAADSTRVVLVAAPGLKLNARLPPALEVDGGGLVRFHSGRLTPDSAYFAEPPEARLAGRRAVVSGTLRASVCPAAERICRPIVLHVQSRM